VGSRLQPAGLRFDSPGQSEATPWDRVQFIEQSPERAQQRAEKMPQSLAQNLIHIIFSTKNHKPLIVPPVQQELKAYLVGTLDNLDSPSIETNCTTDHVHVLCSLSRTLSLAKLLEEFKKSSSKWMKTKGPEFQDFYWQAGYGAFSVSQSKVEAVRRYIRQQAEHHRKTTFQDEFRQFLRKHRIEFDERYVWD